MPGKIKQGQSIFIPFRNGMSIYDSQNKARMYMSKEKFKASFPAFRLGTEDIELLEYAPVETDTNVGSKWISVEDRLPETDGKNTFAYNVLVYIPKRDGCNQHGVYIGKLKGIKADDGSGNFWGFKTQACDWTVWGFSYFEHPVVTHWMPLPDPPKEG